MNNFAFGPGSKTFPQIFSKFQNCKISPKLPTQNWNCIGIMNAYKFLCKYGYMHIYMHTLPHLQASQYSSYQNPHKKRIWNQMLPDRLLFHKAVATNTKTISWVLESFLKIRFSPPPGPVCKKDASTIKFSSICFTQLNNENEAIWNLRDKSPPTFLLVSAFSLWLSCLGFMWEILGSTPGRWLCISNFNILDDTLWLNCSTCFLIYFRKASLDDLPTIIIV